jgi:hypothetical protein
VQTWWPPSPAGTAPQAPRQVEDHGHRQPASAATIQVEPDAIPLPLPAPLDSTRVFSPQSTARRSDSTPGARTTSDSGAPPTLEIRGRAERRITTETGNALSITRSRRALLWCSVAVGCVAVVAIVMVAVRGTPGPRPTAARPADRAPASAATTVRAAAAAAPVAPEPPAALEPPAVTPAEPAPAEPAPKPVPPLPRPAKRFGGKKIVVEYNERPGDAAPGLVAQEAEDPAIARARSAYLGGNQKLFAGDVDGAIEAYHRALAMYPGYVGGYRGLGLAYAQRGDTQKSLEALTTYVTTVPNAKDVPLLKKRIARLQAK